MTLEKRDGGCNRYIVSGWERHRIAKGRSIARGGTRILSRRLTSALDAHELLLHGLPVCAVDHLVGNLVLIGKTESLEKAVGMSLQTWQRRKDAPSKRLSQEQSGRAWKFAGILSKATDVLGTQAEAEQWLKRPAIGLDQRRRSTSCARQSASSWPRTISNGSNTASMHDASADDVWWLRADRLAPRPGRLCPDLRSR